MLKELSENFPPGNLKPGIGDNIMNKLILAIPLLLLLAIAPATGWAEAYQVVFETINCDGSTGFATIGIETIYKIEEGDCSHPDKPEEKLKQLLIHDNSGSYHAYTLSQDEARGIMLEIKAYMKARRGLLERSEAVIVTP